MTDRVSARLQCEGWCHDQVRQPSCVGHFLDCAACVEFKRRSAHIDAQDAKIKALVEAGEAAEKQLVALGADGLSSGITAALAAAKETT